MKLWNKERADAVCQPALFPDFVHEARFEPCCAQDVIEDEGRKEILVIPLNPGMTEQGNRLRRFEIDHRQSALKPKIDVRRQGWPFGWQIAQEIL